MLDNIKWAWAEFKRKPIVGLLFASVLGLGFMYRDLRKDTLANKEAADLEAKDCKHRTRELETKVAFYSEQIRRSDSAVSSVNAKWKLLVQMGIIKIPE